MSQSQNKPKEWDLAGRRRKSPSYPRIILGDFFLTTNHKIIFTRIKVTVHGSQIKWLRPKAQRIALSKLLFTSGRGLLQARHLSKLRQPPVSISLSFPGWNWSQMGAREHIQDMVQQWFKGPSLFYEFLIIFFHKYPRTIPSSPMAKTGSNDGSVT
jgi:hypothetical protein